MTPHVYRFQHAPTRTMVFRGYVKKYEGARILTANCKEVRKTEAEALKDAEKLLKNLSKYNV